MKADTLNLKTLFQRDVRYVIPTFQRPYVWNQEEQWEPLWDDLRNAAERYLDELEAADGAIAVAEERTGSHFMGAVVLQQRLNATKEIETRDVIDGQQRLTTMQLVLDAAQEVFEEIGAKEAQSLRRLVENAYVDGDQTFKLWPTSLDQDAFRAAMTNALSPEGFEDSLIVQAHDFFRLQIREWLEAASDDDARSRRVHGLETALFGLLRLVVIDLDRVDDAFVIFETLNARGTPLLASDLVKNYLLQTATARGIRADDLYEAEWKSLEDAWWRREVAQGRIYRPRLDVFLNYWLIMRTAGEVPASDLFPQFKKYVESPGKAVDAVAADLRSLGAVYRGFDAFEPASVEGTFFYRLRMMDVGVATPLLLWLFSQPESALPIEKRTRCLRALESFLVRRMVGRMTTKNYNDLFLELLSRLDVAGPTDADDVVVEYLGSSDADSRVWPSDHDFTTAFVDLPLYRLLTRGRLRLILEALEDELRTAKTEEAMVQRGTLTIEHVLPQRWRDHWPLDEGGDAFSAQAERERLLHSVGNLTLVNSKLNPSLTNAAWPTKRKALGEHSVLHLNKKLCDLYGDAEWNEATIRARSAALAAVATTIWPSPQSV